MKEQIFKLRNEGLSYEQIRKQLKCSKSLISYYLNPSVKQSGLDRQSKNRFHKKVKYKLLSGGKCIKCGYSKCMDALHFHHRDPSTKDFIISSAIWYDKSHEEILNEISKCDLVCANCHAEIHAIHQVI